MLITVTFEKQVTVRTQVYLVNTLEFFDIICQTKYIFKDIKVDPQSFFNLKVYMAKTLTFYRNLL